MVFVYLVSAVIITLLILIITDYIVGQSDYWKTYALIPGPKSFPIFGNVFDVVSATTKEGAFLLLRNLNKKYGQIWKLKMMYIGSVSLAQPEDIEAVLSTTKHNSKGEIYRALEPWLNFGLLTSDGEKWKNRRKILTPAFHFNILQNFLPVFVEHTNSLVKTLENECTKERTELTSLITETTLHSICETAMGTRLDPKNKTQKKYVDAISRFGEIVIQRIFSPWMYNDWIYQNFIPLGREEAKVTRFLHNFSSNVIKERQINFTPVKLDEQEDDVYKSRRKLAMLDLLLTAKSEGADIDDEGIREEVDTFMFEGHDTTAMCLCFTLMLIANHQDVQEKLLEEIDSIIGRDKWPPSYQDLQGLQYMERVIKESLRLYPSVHYISRELKEDIVTKSGYKVPTGTLVHIEIYDVHRNPEIYPEPEKFDPDRFLPEVSRKRHPFAFIPFSAGPRNCIGQRFAFLEMKTVLSGVLRKYQLLPVDKPEDMVMCIDFILRAKGGVKVHFKART